MFAKVQYFAPGVDIYATKTTFPDGPRYYLRIVTDEYDASYTFKDKETANKYYNKYKLIYPDLCKLPFGDDL